jgi:hypothetical protein
LSGNKRRLITRAAAARGSLGIYLHAGELAHCGSQATGKSALGRRPWDPNFECGGSPRTSSPAVMPDGLVCVSGQRNDADAGVIALVTRWS